MRNRRLAFAAVAAAAVAVPVLYLLHARREAPPIASMATTTPAVPIVPDPDRTGVAFRYTGSGPAYGRLVTAELGGPVRPDGVTGLACDRLDVAGGRGVCLAVRRGVFTTAEAILFDEAFQPVRTLSLTGLPSRLRISPDGRLAAMTVFESGHSYASGDLSTRTSIIALATGEPLVPDLEGFTVLRDGRPVHGVDFNFWGVTFARDPDRFYATLATGGRQYLVEGRLAAREVRFVRPDVECPSLSPDDRRIAFKRRQGGLLTPTTWRLWALELDSLREWPLAETRSVDDQVVWLDDATILYAMPAASVGTPADCRSRTARAPSGRSLARSGSVQDPLGTGIRGGRERDALAPPAAQGLEDGLLANSVVAGRRVEDHDEAGTATATDQPDGGGVGIGVPARLEQACPLEHRELHVQMSSRSPNAEPGPVQLERARVAEQLHEAAAAAEHYAGRSQPRRIAQQLGRTDCLTTDVSHGAPCLILKVIFTISGLLPMDVARNHLDVVRPLPTAGRRRAWCRRIARRLADAMSQEDAADLLTTTALAMAFLEQEPDGAAAARRAAALLDAVLVVADDRIDPEIGRLLDDAADAWLAGASASAGQVASGLGALLRGMAARILPPAHRRPLEGDIASYLAQHLHEGIRLGDLARRLGYSASHCSMLVRRATGVRFSTLRRRMQLERALGLLRSGASVKAAALEAGFSDPAYLSRLFARRFGVPPSRWRDVREP